VRIRLSIPPIRSSRKARSSVPQVQKGNLRARVFLAWAPMSCGEKPPKVEPSVLEIQITEEPTP